MFSFSRKNLAEVPWNELDCYQDRIIFQTLPWLRFVEKTKKAEPVVVEISDRERIVGYLTLLKVAKGPLQILGSPFHGWTTGYMGFNLLPGQSRGAVLQALPDFLAAEFGCYYFQLCDYHFNFSADASPDYKVDHYQNFELDLSQSEDQLFSNMNNDCRRRIRKAEKNGVVFEEAEPEGFAEEFYAQIEDVFTKHRLTPTYDIARVRNLLHYLYPTGNLLLVRAKTPQGEKIATGIYSLFNRTAFAWGFASWRQYQHQYTPNEGLIWYAMKCLKNRGCTWLDMGGWAPYKHKYGTTLVKRSYLMLSKPRLLVPCKLVALKGWQELHKQTSHLRLLAAKDKGGDDCMET